MEERDVAVEAQDCAPDERGRRHLAGVRDQILRCIGVAAVEHEVGRAHERERIVGCEPLAPSLDVDAGLEVAHTGGRDLRLGAADIFRAEEYLPMDIGEVHDVVIDEGNAADATRDELLERRAPQAASAHDEDVRVVESLLRIAADEQGLAGGPTFFLWR